jgi:hypothetical protein
MIPPWLQLLSRTAQNCQRWLHQLEPTRQLERQYQTLSTAPIETLWQTLINLADVSWHPMITSTNVPRGLAIKPGLIYRVMPRWLPIPVTTFVERVLPEELLSIRLFPVPGLEERVIYRLESTMWGTRIFYSVTLKGWLSPLVWSLIKPYAAQVAEAIATAAENTAQTALPPRPSSSEAW